MIFRSNRWDIKPKPDPADVGRLVKAFGISGMTASLLCNRNMAEPNDAEVYLNPSMDRMRNPFDLKDMDVAAERIKKAMNENETICIYGDYDVDGVTSTAILSTYFRNIGYNSVFHHIPDRKTEGYGLNKEAVRTIFEKGCGLIITVDCGISSCDEIEYGKKLGMDVIVTDHHKPPANFPKACAVVNPKRDDCGFGFTELAGAGIAFKLVQALLDENDDLGPYLELSALGTVADVVPLTDENRIIVKKGLEVLNGTTNPGLIALKAVSGLGDRSVDAGNIAFMLAPRINAAGRMGSADIALDLLLSEDAGDADRLANCLNDMNMERQSIEENIRIEAEELIKEGKLNEQNMIVVGKTGWDSGIIGIVASKISEKYCRPVVMIAMDESIGKASCRSFGAVDLYELLDSCRSYFIKFGGHKYAAGFSIAEENVIPFKREIEALAMERISESELEAKISVDSVVNAKKIDFNAIDEISLMEPFGCGNPRPKFVLRNLKLDNFRYVGKNGKHLKASLSENNRVFDAIGFNMEKYSRFLKRNQRIDIVFNLEKNVFRNVESIQLNLKDVRIKERACYAEGDLGRRYLNAFPAFFKKMSLRNDSSHEEGAKQGGESIADMVFEDGTVVAVYTLDGLYRLVEQMEEKLAKGFKTAENLYFGNEKPSVSAFHIAVLPVDDLIADRGYKRVINFDGYKMAFGTDCIDLSEQLDKKSFESMIAEMIPDRRHLVDIYRILMKNGPSGQVELEKSVNVPFLKFSASLWILKDCGLIDFKNGTYEVCEAPEEKIDIFENGLFKKLNEYLQR
ncbi:MAG: single-stranded-DNA-specific exonuclease RecJ, partial [Clostridiales bacterium]